MRKLEVGDVLGKEGELSLVIMATTGKVVAHQSEACGIILWNTQRDLENQGWKLEEPEWKPELGKGYFLANPNGESFYDEGWWSDDSEFDKRNLERGLIFGIAEEAIECAKNMLAK